jgi:REP element-mobilizing transposase RayT
MPNHVHFLARPFEGVELSELTHSIKSYTAHEANKLLDRAANFGSTNHSIGISATESTLLVSSAI